MKTYIKGSRTERELLKIFSEKGYSVIRAAGSGVSKNCPDILLFKRGKQYGIECKAWEKNVLALNKGQFNSLTKWEENTGITTYVGWRRNRVGWRFIPLSLFKENRSSFSVSWTIAKELGRKIEELF